MNNCRIHKEVIIKYHHFAIRNEIMGIGKTHQCFLQDSQILCIYVWTSTQEIFLPKNWTWIRLTKWHYDDTIRKIQNVESIQLKNLVSSINKSQEERVWELKLWIKRNWICFNSHPNFLKNEIIRKIMLRNYY